MRQEASIRPSTGGKYEPVAPSLYGSALGVDVGNSWSLQETGNSGIIIALLWVVRNQGALQVAVPGSQSHGMQLPQEKYRAPAELWCGAGQDRCEPSGTALSHPLEPFSLCSPSAWGLCPLMKYMVVMAQGETGFQGGQWFVVFRKSTGRCAPGWLWMRSPSS